MDKVLRLDDGEAEFLQELLEFVINDTEDEDELEHCKGLLVKLTEITGTPLESRNG